MGNRTLQLVWSLASAMLISSGLNLHADVTAGTATARVTTNRVRPVIEIPARPFDLHDVRLLNGPFKVKQQINAEYLLMLDPDRLLSGFRSEAGLKPKGKRYGGWEAREIHGHGLGHYLTALSLAYAATGDTRMLDRVNYIVDELATCQAANGNGYVAPMPQRIYREIHDGHIKASGFSLNDYWVPNYTLHKIFAGLRDAYHYAGNQRALVVERKLADWLDGILSPLDDSQIQEMLKAEHGGMNEVLADLAVDTGDQRYLQMAEKDFNHKAVFGPLMRGEDRLDGLHANTQIPKIIGLAREYELTGDPADRAAVTTFWDSVVNKRSYVIGGHGEREHFFPPRDFPKKLTPHTAETCNTYNMLKLTGHLFSWQPKADEMDFVERGLINHLLANIGRKPGEFGYFLGLESVAMKVFSTPFDSWWCCVCTGMENPERYGQLVYFHDNDTLWVNLFMGTELNWKEKGLTLRQETRFPDDNTIHFKFTCQQPVKLALKLRHPWWCETPVVKINGKPVAVHSSPSSYETYDRVWKDGDTLELRLPMKLHLESLPYSDGKIVAALYGPSVLAGIVPTRPGVPDEAKQRFSDHLKARGKTDDLPPVFVADNKADVLSHLEPTGKHFAEFRSEGVVEPSDLRFMPLYRVYEEHYAVYFSWLTPSEWTQRKAELRRQEEERQRLEAATVDRVSPGFQQSEVEHAVKSDNSFTGDAPTSDMKWRDARNGGWFSYQMEVDPNQPMTLVCTYWGSEQLERNFDILVDGEKIATQKLLNNHPNEMWDAHYAVPANLTEGKYKVTVKFQAHPNQTAGGLFACRMVRPSEGKQ